ncbi:hypothetical protein SLS53_007916 [Cytospora paraplurivora]|uniref:Uncharacterized protein n=1 Tax=Cytospora paraplurivora TaxID=2898453 RepID=A0AAN9U859_9PEZI
MAGRRFSIPDTDEVPRSTPNHRHYPLNTGIEVWEEISPLFPLPRERLRQGEFGEFPEERIIFEDDDASHRSGGHTPPYPPPYSPREQHPAPGPRRHRAPARERLVGWFNRTVQPSGQEPHEPRLMPVRGSWDAPYVLPARPATQGDDHESSDGGPRVMPPEGDITPLDLGPPVSDLPETPPGPEESVAPVGADITYGPAGGSPPLIDGRIRERLRDFIRRWRRRRRELRNGQEEREGGRRRNSSPQNDERPTFAP